MSLSLYLDFSLVSHRVVKICKHTAKGFTKKFDIFRNFQQMSRREHNKNMNNKYKFLDKDL